MLYALKALAGLRHSEAARLRWSHFNEDLEPLAGLNLGKTKTGVAAQAFQSIRRSTCCSRIGRRLDGSESTAARPPATISSCPRAT